MIIPQTETIFVIHQTYPQSNTVAWDTDYELLANVLLELRKMACDMPSSSKKPIYRIRSCPRIVGSGAKRCPTA